jgi:hypothetical protein
MSSPLRCEWEEGEVFSLSKKARECGLSEDVLKRVVLDLRAALGEYARLPGGIRVDTPRPDVRGSKGFGGFWVGVFDVVADGGGLVRVVVRPRVRRYGAMIEKVGSVLGGLVWLFPVAAGLYASVPRLAVYVDAVRRLYEAYLLASREPKFLTRRVIGAGGSVGVDEGGFYVFRRQRVRNAALANSVVLALRRVVEAVEGARGLAEDLPEDVKGIVEAYLSALERGAAAVLEELGDLTGWVDGEELGPYWHLAARAVASSLWGREAEGVGRYVMIPSTKLYELYVYSLFVERLKGFRACGDSRGIAGGMCIEGTASSVGGASCDAYTRLYFNVAPSSRLVRKLSRKRPRPDAAVEAARSVAVVEAKYRFLRSGRLPLPDSLRLVAYLADVARNSRLKAVLVSLSRPEGLTGPLTAKIGDGVEASVYYAGVNPDGDVEEEVKRAIAFAICEP